MKKIKNSSIMLLLIAILFDVFMIIIDKFFSPTSRVLSIILLVAYILVLVSLLIWVWVLSKKNTPINVMITVYLLICILKVIVDKYFLPQTVGLLGLSIFLEFVHIAAVVSIGVLTIKDGLKGNNAEDTFSS